MAPLSSRGRLSELSLSRGGGHLMWHWDGRAIYRRDNRLPCHRGGPFSCHRGRNRHWGRGCHHRGCTPSPWSFAWWASRNILTIPCRSSHLAFTIWRHAETLYIGKPDRYWPIFWFRKITTTHGNISSLGVTIKGQNYKKI